MTAIDVWIKNVTISQIAIGFSFALLTDAEQFPVRAPQTLRAQEGAALWSAVAQAKVIFVGETHNKAMDHAYELRLVRGMIRRRIAFAIGWEMFGQTSKHEIRFRSVRYCSHWIPRRRGTGRPPALDQSFQIAIELEGCGPSQPRLVRQALSLGRGAENSRISDLTIAQRLRRNGVCSLV